jgi:hypothetical protein
VLFAKGGYHRVGAPGFLLLGRRPERNILPNLYLPEPGPLHPEDRSDNCSTANLQQHRVPPLQKTQGWGTLGFLMGMENAQDGGWATRPTIPAGAATGSLIGGGVGFAGGMIYCAKGVGPRFGGNQRQNKAANDAKRDAERETGMKMTDDQQEQFHDLITHQNFDYHEMVDVGKPF